MVEERVGKGSKMRSEGELEGNGEENERGLKRTKG